MKPREHLPSHHPGCFGCGEENPCGLGLEMERQGDRGVRGRITFTSRHQGAPGLAHGGAVAAAFDDAMGFVLFVTGHPAVTAHLEVDYRKPVVIGREYVLEGKLERRQGRKLYLTMEACEEEGGKVAEARGLFVEVGVEHFLSAVPEEVKKELEEGGTPPW